MGKFFPLGRTCDAIRFAVPIKQHVFDTKCRKTTVLNCHTHRFEKNNYIQPWDCQGRPFLEMLWFWGIQVIDFKKLWGSKNHSTLSLQGKSTHDNSVTEITFEFSISHRKHFLNLKYSVTVMEHMYQQNKNIFMT